MLAAADTDTEDGFLIRRSKIIYFYGSFSIEILKYSVQKCFYDVTLFPIKIPQKQVFCKNKYILQQMFFFNFITGILL